MVIVIKCENSTECPEGMKKDLFGRPEDKEEAKKTGLREILQVLRIDGDCSGMPYSQRL